MEAVACRSASTFLLRSSTLSSLFSIFIPRLKRDAVFAPSPSCSTFLEGKAIGRVVGIEYQIAQKSTARQKKVRSDE
jgi:hypothetical protein